MLSVMLRMTWGLVGGSCVDGAWLLVWPVGWVGWRSRLVQLGCPQFEVALFGQVRRQLGRPEVGVVGGGCFAGLFEQVGAYRFEAVAVGHAVGGVEGAEQGEPGCGPVDHGNGDGAAERDDRSGGDGGEDVVQGEDLRPVGGLGAGGLGVKRGDRGLELVWADGAGAEGAGKDGL